MEKKGVEWSRAEKSSAEKRSAEYRVLSRGGVD
jgi:hypothetical protein